MKKIENAPILESIFEIRWGGVGENRFEFSSQEENLVPGIVASLIAIKGYTVNEPLSDRPKVPHIITNRFRKNQNEWPCVQVGLGIFTVNQVKDGYSWETFKETIMNVVTVFDSDTLKNAIHNFNSAELVLRYQNAFYPNNHEPIGQFIEEHFNFNAQLPDSFFEKYTKDKNFKEVNLQLSVALLENIGKVDLVFSNAMINNVPGFLIDTIVSIKVNEMENTGDFLNNIRTWLVSAHDVQEHAFETIIKESAYNGTSSN